MKIIILISMFSFLFPIVGGWEVDPECPECKYPFNVSLQTHEYYILSELQSDLPTLWDGHFCQGALIDNNWVLTNANCVDIVENNMHIWAEVGLHNINDEISTQADSIAISNIYFHPNYNSEEPWHYNYALLELSENSTYEPIKLISDYNHENIGNSVTLMGWGARSWTFAWIHAYILFENHSTIGECLDGWNGDESLLCLNPWDLDDYEDWEMENFFEEGFPGGGCDGDEGAPLIMTNDDGEYELLGNYFLGCVLNYPHQNKFSRTYIVKDWIYSYIGHPDIDNDGISNEDDNCIEEYNPYQLDTDNDQIGNICDDDDDGDNVLDADDNCPEEYNPYQSNYDQDEQGDTCDWDDDNDNVIDLYDPHDNNEFICGDTDEDDCDDCSSGSFDPENDCPMIYGCTTPEACNYDESANADNDSCIYPDGNYDCDGNCTAGVDCAGDCGGEAAPDECGVCDAVCVDACIFNGTGDVTPGEGSDLGDGVPVVNDIVIIVDEIIGNVNPENPWTDCDFNAANMNGDGVVNVIDVMTIVQIVMNLTTSRADVLMPSSVELIQSANRLSYKLDVDGVVGFELTLSHDDDCEFSLSNEAFISSFNTSENITKMVIVHESGNELFTSTGEFEILDVLVGSAEGAIEASISIVPNEFVLNKAYPNPFNPTTTLSFAIPVDSKVSLSIYNMQGREVSSLIDGNMDAGYHSVVWNADSYSSGIYFVKMVAGEFVNTQKLMLVK